MRIKMVDLPCPVCGRESEGVCLDCFLESKPIEFKELKLAFCDCGRVRYRDAWTDFDDKIVVDLVKRSIRVSRDIVLEKARVSVKDDVAHVVLDLVYDGKKFSRDFDLPIKRTSSTCQICSRKRSSYYEAVLQVRGKHFDFPMNMDYLMKAEKVRGGADYYMTSMNYAKQKAHELLEKGYFVKESSKLVGKKDGVDLYRVYISAKHPDFNIGDVIEHKRKLLHVRGLGRWVKFTELESGKETAYPLNTLKEAKVVALKEDARKAMVTAIRPDGMQVMDLTEYRNYEIPKRRGVEQGDEVEIAFVSGKAYLL